MADIKQIQFKRTSTLDKIPKATDLARGELALNTNGSNLAIYTKNEADQIVQLTGSGVPFLETSGMLVVAGTTTLNGNLNVAKSANFATNPDNSGKVSKLMYGKMPGNSGWYIGSGSSNNKGFLEIGVGNTDGQEIIFVQRGANDVAKNTLKLLDSTGQTRIPGNLYMNGNAVVIKDKAYYGSGGSDIYMRNTAGGANNQLTITDSGNLLFQSKPVYWEGRKPTLAELGINNVKNYRAMKQISVPLNTADSSKFLHIATIKDPINSSAQLDLMISGGIDSGNNLHYTDFVYINGRNLSAFSTTNLGNYIQCRRLGNPGNSRTPSYGIVVSGTGANKVMDVYVEIPRYGSPLQVAVISSSGESVTLVESDNDKGATKPTEYISINMSQIFDSTSKLGVSSDTTGTLPLNRGGTGATTAPTARTALGLGTAAVRDVGTNANQLMQVGAFGLGGSGATYQYDKLPDLVKTLKSKGSQYFRNTNSINNTVFGMGAGFYSSVADVHAGISVDYATAQVRVFATNNSSLNLGTVKTNELFGTANPPTPAQVNAVAKTGDTMTGELTTTVLNARQTHSVGQASFIPSSQGAWVNWNQISGSGTTDFINHKGSGEGGFVFWNSNGTNNTRLASIDSSGCVKADSLNISMYSNATANNIVSISGAQHTQLLLSRNADANLSIGFKLNGKNLKRLGIDSAGDLRFGETDNLVNNALVLTSNTITKLNQSFGKDISVAGKATITGQSNLNGGYIGNLIPINLTNTTTDLNDCYPKYSEPGTVATYQCSSTGGGDKITNKPAVVSGDFILTAEVVRSVNATDLYIKQTMSSRDRGYTWIRWGSVSGSNKTWSDWKFIVLSGYEQDIIVKSVTTTSGNVSSGNDLIVAHNARIGGNIGIGGASSTSTTDKGIVIGLGSTLRESTQGGLILTSSGKTNTVVIRPLGPSESSTQIQFAVSNANKSTSIEYANGAQLRNNTNGDFIIASGEKSTLYFRTNGNGSSTNEMRLDTNGTLIVNGKVTSSIGPSNSSDLTRKDYVDTQVGTRLPLAGGTLTGNLTMSGSAQIINGTTPTDNAHLANKKYVDGQINTRLATAGGTVTGNLDVTGNQLKAKSLWVTGATSINGTITVDGKSKFNSDLTSTGSVTIQNNGTSHVFFRKADGTEKGLVYADDSRNVNIRAGGNAGKTWNFWESGSCQFPGAIANFNGITSTTALPAGGDGTYKNTNALVTRFDNGARVSLYFQEHVGTTHQAVLNVNGYGTDDNFFFRTGGEFICNKITTRGEIYASGNGNFNDVYIRSDRRAKTNVKVIDSALEKVETLTGNTYELNSACGTTISAGLIAQEVQKVLPEAVTQDTEEDGGLLRLNYNSVIALLVESVKELSAEVRSLKAQLK